MHFAKCQVCLSVFKGVVQVSETLRIYQHQGHTCVCAQWLSWVRLFDPVNCGSPGSSVHGILQAGTLEWVAISFSHGRCLKTRCSPTQGEFWCHRGEWGQSFCFLGSIRLMLVLGNCHFLPLSKVHRPNPHPSGCPDGRCQRLISGCLFPTRGLHWPLSQTRPEGIPTGRAEASLRTGWLGHLWTMMEIPFFFFQRVSF